MYVYTLYYIILKGIGDMSAREATVMGMKEDDFPAKVSNCRGRQKENLGQGKSHSCF